MPAAAVTKAAPEHTAPVSAAKDPNAAPFVYSPVGKRDPFRSYLIELERQTALASSGRQKEPTEMFEVDQYHLTAIISGTSQPKAMVEDPTGRGHVVHLGSRLGKNSGRISRITGSELVITEEVQDATGKVMRIPITKRLPRPELDDAAKR